MNENPHLGTELKYKITMTATGFSMDEDDWTVTISRGSASRTFTKADCIHGGDGWYVCFDTAAFGPGQYYGTLTAFVPDNDFPDGTRTEVQLVELDYVEP